MNATAKLPRVVTQESGNFRLGKTLPFNDEDRGARLPKYFFDFRDGGRDRGFDSEGLELVDAERAKREAMLAVTQVIQLETSADDRRVVECRVRDSKGVEVYNVSLGYDGRWAREDNKQIDCGSVSRIRY